MNLRAFSWPHQLVVAVLVMVAIAGIVWGAVKMFGSRPSVQTPQETEKSKHPPIAELRDQLLQHYHGDTSKVFTTTPGFGHWRIPPLARKIPFQIPYFSPTEIEVKKPPQVTGPLNGVITESMAAFQSSPLRKRAEDADGFAPPGFFGLQLRTLDLVGLSDWDKPKVYSGGPAFELVVLLGKEAEKVKEDTKRTHIKGHDVLVEAEPEHPAMRSLDQFEQAGVAELKKGASTFVRRKGNIIRMLGALRAKKQCLKCHEDASQGDLLGAFSYTFVELIPDNPPDDRGGSGSVRVDASTRDRLLRGWQALRPEPREK